MNNKILSAAVIAAAVLLFFQSCATSEGNLFSTAVAEQQISGINTAGGIVESTGTDGSGLIIDSVPGGASVYINHRYAGKTPYTAEDLDTGEYRITVKKRGYYPEIRWITYTAGEDLRITFSLKEITGYLYVKTTPPGADISIGGFKSLNEGVNELPVGSYKVTVSMFGYESCETTVNISENSTTNLTIRLEPAKFRFSRIKLSRERFNPDNPSGLGLSRISFTVSTFGSGTVSVFSPEGRRVSHRRFDNFTTWDQGFSWDGRDSRGKELEDGTYRIVLSGRSRDGDETDTKTAYIVIDHSIIIRSRTVYSGVSGTLLSPTPDILPQGSYQISFESIGHMENGEYRFPSAASLRFSPAAGAEGNISGGIIIQSPADNAYYISAALKKSVVSGTEPFSAAAFLKGTYLFDTKTDPVYNFTGISSGIPVSLSFGHVSLVVSPELAVSPYRASSSNTDYPSGFHVFSYGRGAVILDMNSVWIGLSGTVRTVPFDRGFEFDTPFSAGGEVNWIIPGTGIVLSGFVTADIDSGSEYYINAGGAAGIIH